MTRRVSVLIALTASIATPFAERRQAPLAYEVASVKPNLSGSTSSSTDSSDRRLTATNTTLRNLIAGAYGVRPNRIVAPDWVDSARFDITARAPENVPPNQGATMLKALLAERFKVQAHVEQREQPIYALVVGRSDGRLGPNLTPSADCQASRGSSAGGAAERKGGDPFPCGTSTSSNAVSTVMVGGARTMADLARSLDYAAGDRSVIDRTGLTGTYNFELRFARPGLQSNAGTDTDLPSIFTAVQEQLGLKLESARGPVDVLVVDHVEAPSPD